MALEHVPRCQHVKVNGVQCGSPALRNQAHCYFHTRVEQERQAALQNKSDKHPFAFPVLEDANSIQIELMKVVYMLGAGTVEHKTASLMIYALQTASYNLRHARFEPERLTDIVIDEDTVDLTRIKGPQWAARDFPPTPPREVDDIMRDDLAEDEAFADEVPEHAPLEDYVPEMPPPPASPAPAALNVKAGASANGPRAAAPRKPAAAVVDPTVAEAARRREQKRKLPQFDVEQAMEDQPDSLAAVLLRRMGLPVTDEEEENERRAQAQGVPS